MPMFGIYYIPPAESALYLTSSQVMGYDIRSDAILPDDNVIRQQFDRFDPEWALAAQEFGFHATIGHVMHFDLGRLPQIERCIEQILNLCDPAKPFVLTPTDEFLHVDGPNLTLYYHPNQAMMMFHAMVVALIHPFGDSTPFSLDYANGKVGQLTVTQRHKLAMYHQHWILDDWYPHLRIVGRIKGESPDKLRDRLLELLPAPDVLTVDTICLVVKADGEDHFKLYKEFSRSDYPQPIE